MILEFSTTACDRPIILDRTYSSFHKNMKGIQWQNCSLYINIDKSPGQNQTQQTIQVAKKYFGNVVHNSPDSPNFSKAVEWCFSRPSGQYFFHLQDDWELTKQINIQQLMNMFILNKKAQAVNLRAYPFLVGKFCLLPMMIKTSFARKMIKDFNYNINPQRQIRDKLKAYPYPLPEFIHYPQKEYQNFYVKDIGRQWLTGNKLKRNHHGKDFIKWQEGGDGINYF